MKRFILFIFPLLFTWAQDTIWVRRLDTGFDEGANGIASLPRYLAIAGFIHDGEQNDYLVAKYTQEGDTLWLRRFDGGYDDYAISTTFDPEGNILVNGYSSLFRAKWRKPIEFYNLLRKTLTFCEAGRPQFFQSLTLKLDSLGEVRWTRSEENKIGIGVTTDRDGNVYVSGGFLTEEFTLDFWLQKYRPDGTTLWSRIIDFAPLDILYRATTDQEGNILVTGVSAGESTAVVLFKFNPDGERIWVRTYSENLTNLGIGVKTDPENNVIVAGFVGDTLNNDFLILKYDSEGNLLWRRNFDRAADDEALGVATDQNGNIFVAGISGENYLYDYLLLKYSPEGALLSQFVYDNGDDDEGGDVVCDAEGNPIITGASFANNYDCLTIKYRGRIGLEETSQFPSTSRKGSFFLLSKRKLRIGLPNEGDYRIDLYDLSGKGKKIYEGYLPSGEHTLYLGDEGLSSGLYFLKIRRGNREIRNERLILLPKE
jgi:uncharacterized delta-60 repeat protein